jgi:uncharacterized protein (DUF2235 family)
MSKRILFCSDGTWDDSGKNTNVYKIYKAMQVAGDQIPFYDDGVGADGTPIDRLLGGAFGTGLFQKVKDGYSKISQVCEKGDQVFLFGFSRGAYTARSIAGMIAVCGLPTANFSDNIVETAFQAYRNKDQRAKLLASLNQSCDMFNPQLTMVGVWDTVGSLGIPSLLGLVDPVLYGFLDTSLHPDIQNAYQALAIDERRVEFPATLWTSAPSPGQTIEQVWFTGVHCDVGGSYPDDPDGTALADITLAWMMNKAAALGVTFAAGLQAKYPFPADAKCALDTKHESWNIGWAFPKSRPISSDATLSNSVSVRCQHDNSYRPGNLTFANPAIGKLSPQYQSAETVTQAPQADKSTVVTAGN